MTFFLTSPYAILDWDSFRQFVIVDQGGMVRGERDVPWTRQYRGTTPYLYFIDQQLTWGFGLALGGVALAGALWAAWRLLAALWLLARTTFGAPDRASSLQSPTLYSSTTRVAPAERPTLLARDRLGEIIAWSWVVPTLASRARLSPNLTAT